ncbi:MAG: pentapeptide repeat protein [Ilumatobacteraceae bacterium]|nr:pentapeptide repeat protein [Ilumatobacteraceae bacterium]
MTDDATQSYRGARFDGADFTGATFRECDFSDVRIIGSIIPNLTVTGFAGEIEKVVVNDVDVTAYVVAELDRRHPDRVQRRAVRTVDDHRAMWATIEAMWSATMTDVEAIDESVLHEKIDGEWSFVETLRHLVLATDKWVGWMILGLENSYHPVGLPPTDSPPEVAARFGLDVTAQPSLAEVMDARRECMAQVRAILDDATDQDLEHLRTAEPGPGEGEVTRSVARCLRVVYNEECEHHQYALRDLAVVSATFRRRHVAG